MHYRTPVERAVATYCPDWRVVPANKPGICKVNPETLNSATAPDLTFRYIDISSVAKGIIDWESVQSLRFADAPSRARRVVRPGDVLICTVRPLLGSHAAANWSEQEGFVCSTGFAVIRPCEQMNPHFLRHLPFCEQVTRQLVAWQCGTNYPAVNESDIQKLQLPLPSPEEQRRIGSVLDAVDATILGVSKAESTARQLANSLISTEFDRQHAPTHRLKEYIADIRYGTSQASNERNWGFPTLRIPNVIGDQLSLEDVTYVDVRAADRDRLALQNGDLLIVRTNGNPNYVGRSAVFMSPDDRTWLYASYLIRVRLKGGILPEYVNVFLGTEPGRRELLRRVTTSAGNHNINSNSVRLLSIPVPASDKDQARVVDIASAARARFSALAAKRTALLRLKAAIMADLLSGRTRLAAAQAKLAEAV